MIKIRGSLLSGYFDCPRRSAIDIIPTQISGAGFKIGERRDSISSIVGKAVHAGSQYIISEMKKSLQSDGLGFSIAAYQEFMEKGNEVFFDDVTKNNDTAIKQVQQLVGFYKYNIIPHIDIETVEMEKEVSLNVSDEIKITGTIDFSDKKQIRDLKTGRRSNCMAQLGHYSLIERASGLPARPLFADFAPRTPLNKPFPGVTIVKYDVGIAERCSISVCKAIKSHVSEFEKTGDPWSFPANPKSQLCSNKYCKAYGTNFCQLGGAAE